MSPDGAEETLASSSAGAPTGQSRYIGRYRLLSEIGHGGMGQVFLAEQTEPIKRRVALKVIKAGMDSRDVVARFEAERQALALMEHPGIAKVLDGGVTDQGRPYFVMELVKGVPLTEFCDTQQLSTRDRVALFVRVCNAVQHAHQKGIIHRDLKPSNVLVSIEEQHAVPKVIDFGVAKALSQPLTDRTLVTEVGRPLGTLAYMSPEQADGTGLDVDTRTDVYALGVMLYEVLVGRLPMDPAELGPTIFLARLAMRETNPATPSARLSTLGGATADLTQFRRTSVQSLRRELKGDLDWIVMKAMDTERTRRYETVNGLAMDLQRYLDDEPVVARPPSTGYRLSRFARRNRAAVVAGSLVALTLVAGATVSTIGMVRATRAEAAARQEAERTRQIAAFLTTLFEVSDPGEARGNSITAREILDRGAQRVRTELSDQPLVQAGMMETMGGVYRGLGLYAEAQPLLEQSLALRTARLGADDPEVQQVALEYARLSQSQGRFAQAESLYRRVIGARERTLGPGDTSLAAPLSGLGGMFVTRGRAAEAESLLARAVALRPASAPEDIAFARTLRNLASAYLAQGKYDEAEPLFQRTAALFERVGGPDHPDLGRTFSNLGIVYYFQGRFGDAERYYVRAETILAKALGPDHPNVGSINLNLGEISWRGGQLELAETRMRKALAIFEKRLDPTHPSIATAEYDLANILRDRGKYGEAEPHYQRALRIRETTFGATHRGLAEILRDYAKLLGRTGRGGEAARLEARARSIDGTT
jgi:non-specific serine/threonine protein kinase/serine/threonine-protein kinase